MKINVKAKSAYGILNKETESWVNVDKEHKDVLESIVPGNTYELDKDSFFTKATLVGELKKKATNSKTKQKWTPGVSNKDTMSKEEWAAKDVRISRQGVIQAAVKAVASNGVIDDFKQMEDLADKMLDYVNK